MHRDRLSYIQVFTIFNLCQLAYDKNHVSSFCLDFYARGAVQVPYNAMTYLSICISAKFSCYIAYFVKAAKHVIEPGNPIFPSFLIVW